ncbi:5-dehydro-2-deoxygluconokinase [Hahella sp. CCB-MM4]|uniref:bifunctional 5-dehydro-2-deoxygluconokinase/5-dehydro-2- deoxyphosphogluconate aldolase n=1 Tax=Hahella sp. (strain CCB-MM4) TaxID=1926491 RepID=UPI000B9BD9AC|nr:5-dehydro-2-deoxygluconokinase [Hahella sp. CCB-MM4]OZG72015.1 5-dehydro-2-deoxygluconokinase [Hahella sp. CCB-MM4]
MSDNKPLDLICLGRAAVDLYGEQIGSRLEDMTSFAKYLGGSSGNIAYGAARMGLKSAMLTRVGDEHMGRFVREELDRAGVDTSHVVTDKNRLTGLVILGIKDRETFPLIFYRRDCADMAIESSDFSPEFIASSQALLITGTHFSTEQTHATSKTAMEYAKAAGTKIILDIDYRPVLWGLTSLGDGETRFVSNESVTQHLQTILPDLDLIVGTEEEIHIAGGSTDTIQALKSIRALTHATIVLKLGAQGCTVLEETIPDSMKAFEVHSGVKVEVLNVLGAGDAFLSGFLRGWLRGESHARSCAYANACGALVVSRHGCAPAIPSAEELDDYLSRATEIKHPDTDSRLNYLHRVTTQRPNVDWNDLCILAFDHRKQLFDMAREEGADPERIKYLKQLLVKATEQGSSLIGESQVGVLIDDTYGQDALNDVTGRGWWIGRPVEQPSSRAIEFEGGRSIAAKLQDWPKEHIVKCLIFYHPEDEISLRLTQERRVIKLYQACCMTGHEFLLELIPPKDMPTSDDIYINAMKRFYNLGVFPDWWKLPPQTPTGWQRITDLIHQRAPHCRGVVMLGLDAPAEELQKGFADSAGFDICKGFAVGRTIFSEPSRQWLRGSINDQQFIKAIVNNYLTLVSYWKARNNAG